MIIYEFSKMIESLSITLYFYLWAFTITFLFQLTVSSRQHGFFFIECTLKHFWHLGLPKSKATCIFSGIWHSGTPLLSKKFVSSCPDTIYTHTHTHTHTQGMWGHSEKAAVCNPGREPSPETKLWSWTFRLQNLKNELYLVWATESMVFCCGNTSKLIHKV